MNAHFILAVVAVVPLVQGQMQPTISNKILDAVEAFRNRMPCGFPKYGVPPLAPYKAEHLEFALDNEALQAFGAVDDFRLYGLNDFDVVNIRLQLLLSRLIFKFNWNNVYLKTNYSASSAREDLELRKHGTAKVFLKDLTMWGIVKYQFRVASGKISLKELSVYVSLGEVISEVEGLSNIKILNKKLNRIIEEWVMLAVNDNTNKVAEITNNVALPFINDFLSDKTISNILAAIGNNGGTQEKEPCIPTEDKD